MNSVFLWEKDRTLSQKRNGLRSEIYKESPRTKGCSGALPPWQGIAVISVKECLRQALDVQTLLKVFQTLIDLGATVIVIEHDLDMIQNADYIIDMVPGGGEQGGRIVAAGTPEEIRACKASITGRYL